MKSEKLIRDQQQTVFALAKNYEHGARPVRTNHVGTGVAHERTMGNQGMGSSLPRSKTV